MNIIVTMADKDFFPYLKIFVESLRVNAKYDGIIVMCDIKYKNDVVVSRQSFGHEELQFLNKYNVTYCNAKQLLAKNNIPWTEINKTQTNHRCYPIKQICCCLISKEYLYESNNILFVDADVYFQSSLDSLFKLINSSSFVTIASESDKIQSNWFKNKMNVSNFSKVSSEEWITNKMHSSSAMCAAIYGGKVDIFHQFNLLSWMLSTSKLVKFNCDQLLFNFMCHTLNIPMNIIDRKDLILHATTCSDIVFSQERKKFYFENIEPSIIHLGGKGRRYYRHLGL